MEIAASYIHYFSEIHSSFEEKDKDSRQYYSSRVKNAINDLTLRADFNYRPTSHHEVNFGINYTNHNFAPENRAEQALNEDVNTNSLIHNTMYANELSAYIGDDWSVCNRFKINYGLRLTNFLVQNKSYISLQPRVAVRYLIQQDLSFKASYARMSQFSQQVSNSYISLPTDFWMPITKQFSPLISDQVSAGFFYNLKNSYSFSVEGYYKWMKNLLEYKDGYSYMPANTAWEDKLTSGKGTAYGIDFSIEKNVGRLKGTFGYGLLWTDRFFAEVNKGRHFPSKYDNRHKINLTLSYKINKKMDINYELGLYDRKQNDACP